MTRYVIITPVRDEEKYIGTMIDSILAQEIRPAKWIIVDDGSRDSTAEIVSSYAQNFGFIEVVRLPARRERKPGGETAIGEALRRLSLSEFDFLARFDADLIFEPGYVGKILAEFDRDHKLGIAGGGLYIEKNGRLELERQPPWHVRGALKMYRRECLEQISALTVRIGWDTVDEVEAWAKGWTTRSFPEYRVIHRRPTGRGIRASRVYWERGKAEYYTWSHPAFVLAKAAKNAIENFSLLIPACYLAGFISRYITRDSRIRDPLFAKTRRDQQKRRVKSVLKIRGRHASRNWLLDVACLTASALTAPLVALLAKLGPVRLPLTYKLWDTFGVTPIPYHYYQPVPRLRELPERTWVRDPLAGIDLNIEGQLSLLREFEYQKELSALPIDDPGVKGTFFYGNSTFGAGDAEVYYSIIRHFRPKRIVEVGGGYSTLIAHLAVSANGNTTEHICIEPYERHWLEKVGLPQIIRSRVEDLPMDPFSALSENDILFLDSSHVLRTGGDVWFEYLQVLPNLRPGVLVHVHDVFLPYPYPKDWVITQRRYWTEQYLLQALLQNNSRFEVLLSLHLLSKEFQSDLARACPIYARQPWQDPGSFWIRRH